MQSGSLCDVRTWVALRLGNRTLGPTSGCWASEDGRGRLALLALHRVGLVGCVDLEDRTAGSAGYFLPVPPDRLGRSFLQNERHCVFHLLPCCNF